MKAALGVLGTLWLVTLGWVMSLQGRVAELEAAASPPASGGAAGPSSTGDGPRRSDRGGGERLERSRLAALERRVAQLEGRAGIAPTGLADARLPDENRPAGAPGPAVAPEDVIGALEEADPEVRRRVSELVRGELDKERDERWQRRQEEWAARHDEQVATFAREHDLSDEDAQKLGAMLAAERTELAEVFRSAREGGGWWQVREKIPEVRQRTDENVKALLDDEDAFAAWLEQREQEGFGWGFGPGGRRGEGPGRPPGPPPTEVR